MHTRIETLLKETSHNKFCIQYILSSFHKEFDSSCKFFLFVNENFSTDERNIIYDEWFEKGKLNKEEIFSKYNFKPNVAVHKEYTKHLYWAKITGLKATPTILVNGFKIPENYKIEDLTYFTDLVISAK